MKIRTKLILGYTVISLLIGVMAVIGSYVLYVIEEQFDEFSYEILPVVQALEDLQYNALRIVLGVNEFGFIVSEVQNSGMDLEEGIKEIKNELKESGIPPYRESVKKFEELAAKFSPEYDSMIAELKPAGEKLIEVGEQLVLLKQQGVSGTKILEIEEEIEEHQENFFGKVEKILNHEREEAEELHEELEKTIEWAVSLLLLAGIVTFALAIVLGLVISQTLAAPIVRLTQAVKEIGKKNFETRVEVTSNDEVGVLSKSFNQMAEDLGNTTVSKKYFESIVNSMNNSLIVLTKEGIIREINQTTCYFLGYKEEELLGQSIEKIIDLKVFSEDASLDSLSFIGFINNLEILYRTKAGESLSVVFSGSTMETDEGKIGGYVCVAQNITDLKELRERLKQN